MPSGQDLSLRAYVNKLTKVLVSQYKITHSHGLVVVTITQTLILKWQLCFIFQNISIEDDLKQCTLNVHGLKEVCTISNESDSFESLAAYHFP